MQPGSVQPGSGTGNSWAPVARMRRRGRTVHRVSPSVAAISGPGNAPHAMARSVGTAAARTRRRSARRLCGSATAAGLKYWPPSDARSSSSSTSAPDSCAAIAAARPAGPPPTTNTPGSSCRAGSAASFCVASSGPIRMPSRTIVMQARWPALPSMVTMQSKQAPMPQCTPRGAPSACWRTVRRPAPVRAAATVSPARAGTGSPSTSMKMERRGRLSIRRIGGRVAWCPYRGKG